VTSPQESRTSQSFNVWRADGSPLVVTRIAIAGDFLPAGHLPSAAHSSWGELAEPLAPYFSGVATTFANLECSIDVADLPPRPLNGIGQIVSANAHALDYLAAIKCHAVGIANNHAYDFGQPGVDCTRHALAQRQLAPLGAGRTLAESPEVFVWRGPSNLRIGFWAAAKAARDIATRTLPGVEPSTARRAAQALDAMKQQGANFFVALLHAGCLRASRPAPEDVGIIRQMARLGFHVVAASHSHRISGCETIVPIGGAPSFCFYGLGSVVSGYIASPLEREGLIVVAGFDTEGAPAEISIRPVYLPKSGIGEVPSPEIARAIIHRFQALSAEIVDDSSTKAFYNEMSQGLVRLYLRDARAALRQSGLRGLARKAARVRLCHLKRLMHRVFAT
jgi:hypothetical protein